MAERLQPFEHTPPKGIGGWLRFQLRLLVDFQVRTVYQDLKKYIPQVKGKVLDLGCGLSPYEHLLNPTSTEYIGLDIDTSADFGYGKTKVLRFDGQHIPFSDASIDCVMCTEVLEHVENARQLVDETYRVLKPGGCAVVTVPWSARVHYIPFDYYRFTPYVLKTMFRDFSCTISPRGTDITVIVSKVMILYLRNFLLSKNVILGLLHLLLMLVFAPFIILCVLIGHLSLMCRWGSPVRSRAGWDDFFREKNNMTKRISAIIASYKDEMAIPHMHRRLTEVFRKIGVDYEIIFVNDGSPDNTETILQELVSKDPHVIAVNHSRNFNSQMAFTSGMDIASGDAMVLLDGDLQDPPELIEEFYKKWMDGFDVVYGVRTQREAPLLMQWAYKLFYRIFHKLSYIKIPLNAGDFSLMDSKVTQVMKAFPERDRFLRGLRAWTGFRQTGVPYVRPERMFGQTTNNFFKNFNWATKGIFSFSYIPLEMMILFSLAVFFVALLGIIVLILLKFIYPSAPQGFTTILVSILFMGAIQLLGMSVLGQYIGKIFEEVKARPKYIVKSIVRHEALGKGRQ